VFGYVTGGVFDTVVLFVLSVRRVRNGGAYFGRGMRQAPSTLLRYPCTMVLSYLVIISFSFEKVAVQLSSQSLLIDMSDPVARLFRTWPCCAFDERTGARGTVTLCVASILWPSYCKDCGAIYCGCYVGA